MSGETDTITATAGPTADSGNTRVVLVDARPDRRAVMRQMFEHSGVVATVVGEADGDADAIIAVKQNAAELVVIDLPPNVQSGLDVVSALDGRFPALAIVVCSFNSDAAVRQRALDAGADAYLVKPVSAREVMAAFRDVSASMPSPAAH